MSTRPAGSKASNITIQNMVRRHCVTNLKYINYILAQELREARGQRLIIENGEVKDVSPNVSLATRATPTVTRTGRIVRKPENPDFEENVIHSTDSEIYETVIEEQVIDDQDHHEHVEQDDSMDMSGNNT